MKGKKIGVITIIITKAGAAGHELAITLVKKAKLNDDIWKERDKTINNEMSCLKKNRKIIFFS